MPDKISVITVRHPLCSESYQVDSIPALKEYRFLGKDEIQRLLEKSDLHRVSDIKRILRNTHGNILLEKVITNITHAEQIVSFLKDNRFHPVSIWLSPALNHQTTDDPAIHAAVLKFEKHTAGVMPVLERFGRLITLKEGDDIDAEVTKHLVLPERHLHRHRFPQSVYRQTAEV